MSVRPALAFGAVTGVGLALTNNVARARWVVPLVVIAVGAALFWFVGVRWPIVGLWLALVLAPALWYAGVLFERSTVGRQSRPSAVSRP